MVARLMAMRVIDLLEAIEINEHHSDSSFDRCLGSDKLAEMVQNEPSIGQSSQGVNRCIANCFLFGTFLRQECGFFNLDGLLSNLCCPNGIKNLATEVHAAAHAKQQGSFFQVVRHLSATNHQQIVSSNLCPEQMKQAACQFHCFGPA